MRRGDLDSVLANVITEKLADPDFLYSAIETQRKQLDLGENRRKAEGIRREIAEAQAEQGRLNTLFRKGRISEDELDRESVTLEATIAAAKKHLNDIIPTVPKISKERLAEILFPLTAWETLTTIKRRGLLTAISPIFKVTGQGNRGVGAGARTKIVVNGSYLMLADRSESVNSESRTPTALNSSSPSLTPTGSPASTRSSAK